MRKIAAKLMFSWLPSAAASFIGGLALDWYLHRPIVPALSPKIEMAAPASTPIAMDRPDDAASVTVSESTPASAPGAVKTTAVEQGSKAAPQRSPGAAATRNRPPNVAIALDPARRENTAAVAGARSAAQAPIGAAAPVEAAPVAEDPSLAQVSTAPQPFSMAEFKQRLAARTASRVAWSDPCDDRFGPVSPKRCAAKPAESSVARHWP